MDAQHHKSEYSTANMIKVDLNADIKNKKKLDRLYFERSWLCGRHRFWKARRIEENEEEGKYQLLDGLDDRSFGHLKSTKQDEDTQ